MNLRLTPALILVLLLAMLPALAPAAHAAGPSKSECALAGIRNPAQLESFLNKLRQAVAAGDKAAVAALADYPLQVNPEGDTLSIESKDDFIGQYDAIMTPKVREAALGQKLDGIFINKRGVMLTDSDGDQRLLLLGDGKTITITTIINN